MENVQILHAPNWELAKKLNVEATVEAEYGEDVLKGSIATLAHHTKEFQNCPAPCNNLNVPILPKYSKVVISHLDLDTLGGILALLGIKPEHEEFWKAAEFVDLNGIHVINFLEKPIQEMLEAYWASAPNMPRLPRNNKIEDVTSVIKAHYYLIKKIIEGSQELIEKGKVWKEDVTKKVQECLIAEDGKIRVFETNSVRTSAAYYSPQYEKTASITITLNTRYNNIRIATSDNLIDCKEIVRKLWGEGAGGRSNISGSPRGKNMSHADLLSAVRKVKEELEKKHVEQKEFMIAK